MSSQPQLFDANNAAFLESLKTPPPVKPQTLRSRIATLWKMGIPAVPLHPESKEPATLHAAYDATTDRAVIAQWVKKYSPNSNAAAVARYDGFWFLDDDRGTLAEAYKSATGQELPRTFKVKTSRGFHYYFRHDDASRLIRYGIKENSGVIETPEFKGEARCNYQYVVASGSVHPSGTIYEVDIDTPPIAAPVALLKWLQSQYAQSESLKPESEKPKSNGKSDSGFAKLFDAVGYRPLENRINALPDAGVHLERGLKRGDVLPCPMPQHKHNDYTPCFGSIKNAPEILHCLGNCQWSGDMVAACYQLDGGSSTHKTMYDCARAICKEEGLNFEEFFSKSIMDAESVANDGTKLPDAKPIAAKKSTAVMEDPEVKSPLLLVPPYPMNTIDGDLIGECTRALTVGTFIPPQFMRENIKTALGLILDGLVGYPSHTDIHLREYLHNVSQFPQSGKGESWKRSVANSAGFLAETLKKFGVNVTDGGVFGSGEYMVKRLNDSSGGRVLARFDEMSAVWTKTKTAGNIIEKMFLQLYEGGAAAQGSFKNGSHAVADFHYAHVGDFTRDSFDASFTGSGSRGSGYLSRCVFQFAEKQPWEGDWLDIDFSKAQSIVGAIQEKIEWVRSYEPQQDKGESRLILIEDDDAKALRLDFYKWLDTQDSRFTPRIKDHLKRDAILRAVFSNGDGDSHITADAMQRSIDWSKNQLDTRLAIFPEDGGSATEIMERLILKCVSSGNASERDLKKACHVDRPGSGGHEAFNRALRSLIFGHEVTMLGKNRKGLPIYGAFDEVESPPKS